MKRLIVIALLVVSAKTVFSQYYYLDDLDNTKSKSVTFQVAPTAVYFDGMKFGVGIGLSIKQVISVHYFHTRDYGVNKDIPYLDNRFGGLHLNVAQPLSGKIELAFGIRKGTLNSETQKTVFTGELRYKFNNNFRLALEFGGNRNNHMNALKWVIDL